MDRRTLLKTAAGAAAFGVMQAPAVHAQGAWPVPGRTVKVIVPWPPGAANDALGRLLAQKLQEKFGASTVVENRTGGSGLVGTNAVIQCRTRRLYAACQRLQHRRDADGDQGRDLRSGGRPRGDGAHRGCPAGLHHDRLAPAKRPRRDARRREGEPDGVAVRDFLARLGRDIWRRSTSRAAPASSSTSCPIAAPRRLSPTSWAAMSSCCSTRHSRCCRREGPHAGSRARHRVEDALATRARACHHRRAGAAGLRVQFVVRRVGAEGHAARHLREGQRA